MYNHCNSVICLSVACNELKRTWHTKRIDKVQMILFYHYKTFSGPENTDIWYLLVQLVNIITFSNHCYNWASWFVNLGAVKSQTINVAYKNNLWHLQQLKFWLLVNGQQQKSSVALWHTDRMILKSVEKEFRLKLWQDNDLCSTGKSSKHDGHFTRYMKEW